MVSPFARELPEVHDLDILDWHRWAPLGRCSLGVPCPLARAEEQFSFCFPQADLCPVAPLRRGRGQATQSLIGTRGLGGMLCLMVLLELLLHPV